VQTAFNKTIWIKLKSHQPDSFYFSKKDIEIKSLTGLPMKLLKNIAEQVIVFTLRKDRAYPTVMMMRK
jgi:hypothetical protein